MFQASINGYIVAEANTRTELAAQVAHDGDSINDCKVVELAAFEAQVKEARQHLGLVASYEMLWGCDGGLTLSTLERFCTDGHTDDDDLRELAEAFEQAGATKAATICRGHIGL